MKSNPIDSATQLPTTDEAAAPAKKPWYTPFTSMIAGLILIYCIIAFYGSCKGEGTRREAERVKLLTKELGSVENFLRYEEAQK